MSFSDRIASSAVFCSGRFILDETVQQMEQLPLVLGKRLPYGTRTCLLVLCVSLHTDR